MKKKKKNMITNLGRKKLAPRSCIIFEQNVSMLKCAFFYSKRHKKSIQTKTPLWIYTGFYNNCLVFCTFFFFKGKLKIRKIFYI